MMSALIIAVDPGRRGALAILDTEGHRVTCHDLPTTTAELHELIAGLPLIRRAVVERPFYPSHVGTSNVATMAFNYGVLLGALAWRSIPVVEVAPAKWKAALGLSSVKDASRELASRIFPDDAHQWKLKTKDGRAEAALIAWWGANNVR